MFFLRNGIRTSPFIIYLLVNNVCCCINLWDVNMYFIKKSTGTVIFRTLKLTSLLLNFFLGICFSAEKPVARSAAYGPPSAYFHYKSGTIQTSDSTRSPLKDVWDGLNYPPSDSGDAWINNYGYRKFFLGRPLGK